MNKIKKNFKWKQVGEKTWRLENECNYIIGRMRKNYNGTYEVSAINGEHFALSFYSFNVGSIKEAKNEAAKFILKTFDNESKKYKDLFEKLNSDTGFLLDLNSLSGIEITKKERTKNQIKELNSKDYLKAMEILEKS